MVLQTNTKTSVVQLVSRETQNKTHVVQMVLQNTCNNISCSNGFTKHMQKHKCLQMVLQANANTYVLFLFLMVSRTHAKTQVFQMVLQTYANTLVLFSDGFTKNIQTRKLFTWFCKNMQTHNSFPMVSRKTCKHMRLSNGVANTCKRISCFPNGFILCSYDGHIVFHHVVNIVFILCSYYVHTVVHIIFRLVSYYFHMMLILLFLLFSYYVHTFIYFLMLGLSVPLPFYNSRHESSMLDPWTYWMPLRGEHRRPPILKFCSSVGGISCGCRHSVEGAGIQLGGILPGVLEKYNKSKKHF